MKIKSKISVLKKLRLKNKAQISFIFNSPKNKLKILFFDYPYFVVPSKIIFYFRSNRNIALALLLLVVV